MTLPISIEFFPPKTPEGVEKLRVVRQQLYALKPQFCSVTYGAGGSTQGGTMSTVREIIAEGCEGAPHFSCIGATQQTIREQLATFKKDGIRRLVALRGDLPSGYGGFGEFRYASDLVAFIRAETGDYFHIEVGAYPEVHPQARTPEADLKAFVTKVRAGASSAITQYFYNPDAYFRFVDDARKAGVDVPIVPGVMPITNSSQIIRFSENCGAEIPRWIRLRLEGYGDDRAAENCGAEIPRWIRLRLEGYGDDRASIQAFGLDVVTALCERLRAGGVPGIHFYALNMATATTELCRRLGLGC